MNMNRDEQLRQRAYRIWEAEGRAEGLEAEHWARAERERAGEEAAAAPATATPAPRSRRKAPGAEPAAGVLAESAAKKAPSTARKPAAPRGKKD
jgi:nucleoid-associated protein YgaU